MLTPDVLSARKVSDGAELWSKKLKIDQPLAAGNGHVFATSGETLYAIDASNGNETWKVAVGPVTAPPLVQNDWIIVATKGQLTALRAADGSKVWGQESGLVTERPAIDGDRLFVPFVDGNLAALSLKSGAPIWQRKIGTTPTEPLVYGDRLYIGSDRLSFGSESKEFFCFKVQAGDLDWSKHAGARVIGRAAIDSERVYFVAMDNVVRALDRVSGNQRWYQVLNFRPTIGPVVLGSFVTVAGLTTEIPAFSAVAGKPAARLALDNKLAQAPEFIPSEPSRAAAIAVITASISLEWKLSVAEVPPPAAKHDSNAQRTPVKSPDHWQARRGR